MTTRDSSERRARRLLRWYPAAWRDRYGDEFSALLECELDERPTSARRTLDVAWSGIVARAATAGLAGVARDSARQPQASLAWLVAALGAFLGFGLAMWSQLVVGWQWTSPKTTGTTWGTIVMSVGVAAFVLLAAVAATPLVVTVLTRILRGHGRRLVVPASLCAVSVAVLVIGARAFENGWPGTGGHHWALQGMVPGGPAAFLWALTLGISSYWAHPAALGAFPTREVLWMAASPIVMVAAATGAAMTLRRLELSERVARFELRVGLAATAVMGAFLCGAVLWLFDHQPRPRSIPTDLFHVGVIDVVGVAVMAIATLLAWRAAQRGLASRVVARTA